MSVELGGGGAAEDGVWSSSPESQLVPGTAVQAFLFSVTHDFSFHSRSFSSCSQGTAGYTSLWFCCVGVVLVPVLDASIALVLLEVLIPAFAGRLTL